MMFGALSLDDRQKMVDIRQSDHFPYQFNGEPISCRVESQKIY